MFEKLIDLSGRIDRQALRVRRPKKTIFLCGGRIAADENLKSVLSVRDYLVRYRSAASKIAGNIVLAETAQQLYRDTHYPDLISFEEDVARIASIVLVISESAGSLAELGAFASEDIIRSALRLLISESHYAEESFVRYGPVKRIENITRQRIGTFPWRTHKKNGYIVKQSIRPHYGEIIRFINDRIAEIPDSLLYRNLESAALFYDILWIVSLLDAVPPEPLYDAVRVIHPLLTNDEIRNSLYILKTCQWLSSFSYAGRDFYYIPENHDPYEYAFLPNQRVRDVAATKIQIATDFRADADIGKAITKRLQEKRQGAA